MVGRLAGNGGWLAALGWVMSQLLAAASASALESTEPAAAYYILLGSR